MSTAPKNAALDVARGYAMTWIVERAPGRNSVHVYEQKPEGDGFVEVAMVPLPVTDAMVERASRMVASRRHMIPLEQVTQEMWLRECGAVSIALGAAFNTEST